MPKTLRERLKLAMREASVTAADIARACDIKPGFSCMALITEPYRVAIR